ncbi:MAG TPA: helix-turn-helix domain-containing protein [Rhizomicrobium sp.]|jgi:phage repressor protein C with HTH and peptisase S24 domain
MEGFADGGGSFRLPFGERMRYLLDLFESRPEAAKVANVTPEHLASYISEKAKPRFATVARLAQAKGVSLEWLATGEGRARAGAVADGFAAVPVLEAESSSGPGSYPLAEDVREHLAFSRAWLQYVIRVPEERLVLVYNRGHDNEPAILDGEAMLVAKGLDRIEDGWHVFDISGRLMTMFVRYGLDGRVGLSTLRTESKPEFFPVDGALAKVFGRVRWRGRVV